MTESPYGSNRPLGEARSRAVNRTRLAAAVAVLSAINAVSANGQAIVAPAARTLFNRAVLVRSFTRVERRTVMRGGEVSTVSRYVQPTALVYGFAPHWNVAAIAPFVVGERNGWADAQFLVKYDGLYRKNVRAGFTRLSMELGVRAPTGTEPFTTGAMGFVGGLIFEKTAGGKFFIADVEHIAATRNKQGVTVGSETHFDLAFARLWLPNSESENEPGRNIFAKMVRRELFTVLELNGRIRNRARNRNSAISDTGGGLLFVSPGLQYYVRRDVVLEFSVPIPVLRRLNGVQARPEIGYVVGFRYLL